jgi:N-carbamoylputrescine amidase
MSNVIRAALVQTTWTGDKETMTKAHEEYAREASAQGARVICFQELFYGPYFCQVQDAQFYEYAESRARRPSGSRPSRPSSGW